VPEHQARRDAQHEDRELLMDSTARIFAIATGGASGGCRTAGGFAMLEVLITLLILLLGLLGLLGLMTRANTAELESYQRVQAVILMRDMFNRIESNRSVAGCYSNGTVGTQFGTGYADTPTCTLGSAETKGGNKIGAMIGARGCITQLDATNNIYMISVVWQGMTPTAAPKVTCGQGQYGATETLRRAVTLTLRIGILS